MNLSPLNTFRLSGTVTNSQGRQWHSTMWNCWADHLTEAQCSYSYHSTQCYAMIVCRMALGWMPCLILMINKHIISETSLQNSLLFARCVSCVKRRFRCPTFTRALINRKDSENALQECVSFMCVLFFIVWSRNVYLSSVESSEIKTRFQFSYFAMKMIHASFIPGLFGCPFLHSGPE